MKANLLFKTILTSLILFSTQLIFGQVAADFSVTDTDGITRSLYKNHLDEGQVVVVKIFFVNCPPCNAIAPEVQTLYEKWGSGADKVEFIELTNKSFDDDADVIGYKTKHGLTFPSVSASGGSLDALTQFQNGTFGPFSGTPTFIIIDPKGNVVYDPVGLDKVDEEILAATMVTIDSIPDCPTNDIMIMSQEDLNSYRDTYPNCTNFEGNITINADVPNLTALSSIQTIVGTLEINSQILNSLSGLSNLTDITEKLIIKNSGSLNNLAGLSNLTNVTGDIELTNNSNLTSLQGLNNLASINKLTLENNSNLNNIFALTNLTSVLNSLTIRNNRSLTSLKGLDNLATISLTLTIRDNISLTDINDIQNLTRVSTFTLIGNGALETCTISSLCDLLFGNNTFVATNISGNGTNCDSKEVLEALCFPVEELPTSFAIEVIDGFNNPVSGVKVIIKSRVDEGINEEIGTSDANGLINFQLPNQNITDFENLILEAEAPSNASVSGVSGVDVVQIQNHILGFDVINDPYKLIAADANGSGSISGTDLVNIINVIVGKNNSFPNDRVIEIINQDCILLQENCEETPLLKSPGNTNTIKIRAIGIGNTSG